MRGDSVRDLYAKALAVIGLGMLAGAGALVDYWPVQTPLPDANFAFNLPAGPGAIGVSAVRGVTVPVRWAVAAPAAPVAVRAATVESLTMAVTSDTAIPDAAIAQSIQLLAPPEPAPAPVLEPQPVAVAASTPGDEPDTEPTLSPLGTTINVLPSTAPFEMPSRPTVSLAARDSGGNLLTKTGNALLNVGYTAGTGVSSFFKALGHAFMLR